jgi:hypothetical protein
MKLIPSDVLIELFAKYRNGDIKDIAQGSTKSLILIVSSSRIKEIQESSVLQGLKTDLFKLVIEFSGEKISSPDDIYISFETHETFIGKHQGSWYNLFR